MTDDDRRRVEELARRMCVKNGRDPDDWYGWNMRARWEDYAGDAARELGLDTADDSG